MTERKGSPVSLATLLLYALPSCGITMLMSPVSALLPGIYATRYGISMASIGTVLLVVRVFDAFVDPAIGVLADRTKARRGTRKPWVAAGALISVVSALYLYAPPQPVTALTLCVGFFVFYVGWSTFEIPHSAWVTHLAPDYAGRSRAFGVRMSSYYLGSTFVFAIPLFAPGATGQYSPTVLLMTWGISACVILIGTVAALARVPDPVSRGERAVTSLVEGWRAVARNGALRRFLAAYTLSSFGFGMSLSLNYVYMQSVVGLSDRIPLIYTLGSPAALVGIVAWTWVAGRYSKTMVWLVTTVGAALVFLAFLAVPRSPASFPLILALNLALFFTFSGLATSAPAVLADIVDYGRLKFREDMGATYYSFFSMLAKAAVGVAGGLGFALAGAFGFEAQAGAHSPGSVNGFMLAFSIVPAALALLGVPFILGQPINRRRHAIIARALQRRDQPHGHKRA